MNGETSLLEQPVYPKCPVHQVVGLLDLGGVGGEEYRSGRVPAETLRPEVFPSTLHLCVNDGGSLSRSPQMERSSVS